MKTASDNTSKDQTNQIGLGQMADQSPVLMAMLDQKGKFTAVNKRFCKTFGLSEEDVKGRHYSDVLPIEFLDIHGVHIENALIGTSSEFQFSQKLKDGRVASILAQYNPLTQNESSFVSGCSMQLIDISKSQKDTLQIERDNQLKDELLAVLAHEIKNPISLLQGALYLERENEITMDEWFDYTNRVNQNLNSLNSTLENLLKWTRIKKDDGAQKANFQLGEALLPEIDRVKGLIQSKNITIKVEADIDKHVYGIVDNYRVAISNLLSNAIKFTQSGKSIAIGVEEQAESVVMKVTDEGVGMSEVQVSKLLKDDFVPSEFGTDGEKGTGVGFGLTKSQVTQAGGKIQLTSQLGVGTSVAIVIPKAKAIRV